MPRYAMIEAPQIRVSANQFKIGHPVPSGSRTLTAGEALALCNGRRKDALFALTKYLLVPTLTKWGEATVTILVAGDWVIRLDNGAVHVVTDEQFHRQFMLIEKPEGKSCAGKRR